MNDKLKHIFSQSDCIPSDILDKYAANLLSGSEKHLVEKHIHTCEICTDELEGLMLLQDSPLNDTVVELNKLVEKRVDELNENKKKKIFPLIIRLSAAVIILLLISTVLYYSFNENNGLNNTVSDNVNEEQPAKSIEQQKDSFKTLLEKSDEKTIDEIEEKSTITTVDDIVITDKTIISDVEPIEMADEEIAEEIAFGWDSNIDLDTKEKDGYTDKEYKSDNFNAAGESLANNKITSTLEDSRDTEIATGKTETKKVAELENIKIVDFDASGIISEDSNDKLLLAEEAEVEDIVISRSEKKEKEREKGKDKDGRNNRGIRASANKAQVAAQDYYRYADIDQTKNDRKNNETIDEPEIVGGVTNINAPATVATNNQQNEDYTNARIQFEAENYEKAAKLFERVLIAIPQHYSALYYSALSYIELNQIEKAIINLDKVLLFPDGDLYNAAKWNKAKALILDDKPQQSKPLLEDLIENNTEFKSKATEVLEELN